MSFLADNELAKFYENIIMNIYLHKEGGWKKARVAPDVQYYDFDVDLTMVDGQTMDFEVKADRYVFGQYPTKRLSIEAFTCVNTKSSNGEIDVKLSPSGVLATTAKYFTVFSASTCDWWVFPVKDLEKMLDNVKPERNGWVGNEPEHNSEGAIQTKLELSEEVGLLPPNPGSSDMSKYTNGKAYNYQYNINQVSKYKEKENWDKLIPKNDKGKCIVVNFNGCKNGRPDIVDMKDRADFRARGYDNEDVGGYEVFEKDVNKEVVVGKRKKQPKTVEPKLSGESKAVQSSTSEKEEGDKVMTVRSRKHMPPSHKTILQPYYEEATYEKPNVVKPPKLKPHTKYMEKLAENR